MGTIRMRTKGSWNRRLKAHNELNPDKVMEILNSYGEKGVSRLAEATPKDTGKTARSWYYKVRKNKKENKWTLMFCNRNLHHGECVAMIIQYGHALPNGFYVAGIDYINPVVKPLFDSATKDLFK